MRLAHLRNAGEEVICLIREERGVDDGARRHDADDLPFHKTFDRTRIFHLLGDRDAVAFGDKFVDVSLTGMERNACHRDLMPFGQGQIEFAGDEEGVIVKRLVKISQTEK